MTPSESIELRPPADPVAAAPPRPPGSARRSSHVDMIWPDGRAGDPTASVVLSAAARDVVTDPAGRARVAAEATLRTDVAADRVVTALAADPETVGLDTLVGLRAAGGWRAATRRVEPAGLLSPLGLLLDEVPIAVMLSMYAGLRSGRIRAVGDVGPQMRDMCAGWATEATPMRALDAGEHVPLPGLAPAPPDAALGPYDAEPREPLRPGSLRRTRRIDVVPGDVLRVDATFRDSWHDPAAGVGVLHEYLVTARVDPLGVVLDITAEPRVLPYGECPRAAAAPQTLVGRHVEEAARRMPDELAGVSSCTHLNDLLRALACVPALAALAGGSTESTGDGAPQ